MSTFTFVGPLYNAALVEATKIKGTEDYIPIISTDIRIILKWNNAEGNTVGYIRLYPNPSGDVICEHGTDSSELLYDDPLYNIFVTKNQKQTRNFFQQLDIERFVATGGNIITLVLFDARGKVIDDTLLYAYLTGIKSNKNINNVTLSIAYGWGNTDLEKWGTPIGSDMVLQGINVNTEYFGTTYTLTFADYTSMQFNTSIQGWQTIQPEGQSQSTEKSNDEINFPQALVEAWKLFHKAKKDIYGNGGKMYLLASSVNKNYLSKEVYEGTGQWLGKTKSYADWNPTDKLFKSWIEDNLKNDFPADSKIKYTLQEINSGGLLEGSPDDYWIFDGEKWDKLSNLPNPIQKVNRGFRFPFNVSFIALAVDTIEQVANSETTINPSKIIKYFIYATTIRSPHATVLKLDVNSSDVLGLYMARDNTKWIPKEYVPETDLPTKKEIVTGTPLLSNPDGDAANRASPAQDSPADPKSTSNANQGESIKTTENAAMLTVNVSLEVLGDPDLVSGMGNYVIIDFDQYVQSLLSWVKGVYLITKISEYLTNGIWTIRLELTKVAEIPPGIEFNRTTGLVKTPEAMELVCTPYQDSLHFLKVTNYLEWLMGALGIAEVLGNLIGGVVSTLSSIYGGILSMFTNDELANITNTIQNSTGGKSYGGNYQNLGSNTSQNATQQYYQAQAQTTKEVLSDYFENFSKLDDIEDISVRKDVAMLATKFGGDMVRNEVIDMKSNGEEISVDAIKERLIRNKKWYRIGDKNFAVNVKNFSLKRLKMPTSSQSNNE
jgi:hypothetical protein